MIVSQIRVERGVIERRQIVKLFTVTESDVLPRIELTDGQQPFMYFDRGAGGGTHFFAHHKVVCSAGSRVSVVERASVAEESFGRYWLMPELDGDTERTLVLVKVARTSRIRPYQRDPRIRVLASDKIGNRLAMLVLSPGALLTIQRPEHLFAGLALVTIDWDGISLGTREYEDPEGAIQNRNLTYI